MTTTSMVHVRMDHELKEQSTKTLNAMGLTISDAVRLFLHPVVTEQALPFELKIPNARTREAMKEAEEIIKSRNSRFTTANELFDDLENRKK